MSSTAIRDPDADWIGGHDSTQNMKRTTARGALTSVAGQGANLVLRLGSMVIMARLVTPRDFGLVGMVLAFTGFLSLFRDAGLSQATVQREVIDEELISTLFWINLGIGGFLATLTALAAPAIAAFYGDERLVWITIALGTGFIFSGASAQHRALLQRAMRFGALVTIDVVSLLASIGIGVWMALLGMGYWALVAMSATLPVAGLVGTWAAVGWLPGRPSRRKDLGSMLHFGGVITLNSLVVYVAYNLDKVLLGRVWGAQALGVYGRAYQLISLPTDSLHTTIGFVMFPALSRVQQDPQSLRNYFLKGYGPFLSVVMPITAACGLFASDIVRVLLGPQWGETVPVFRLLAPTILAFALINPMGYLMTATGRAVRSLKIAFVIAPVVVLGYVIGLPYGARGVALGFSIATLVLVVPVVMWATRGTSIRMSDLGRTVIPPIISTLLGGAAALVAGIALRETGAFARLVAMTAVLFSVHGLILLFGFRQRQAYLNMLRATGVWPSRFSSSEGKT